MKVIDRLKESFIRLGIFLLTISTKVFAIDRIDSIQTMYGVPEPKPGYRFLNILRIWVIPIILMAGLLIYIRKSKKFSKLEKVFIIIGGLIVVRFLQFVFVLIKYYSNY